MRLQDEWPWNRGLISNGQEIFLFRKMSSMFLRPVASYRVSIRPPVPSCENDHSYVSSVKLRKPWSCISTIPCPTWCGHSVTFVGMMSKSLILYGNTVCNCVYWSTNSMEQIPCEPDSASASQNAPWMCLSVFTHPATCPVLSPHTSYLHSVLISCHLV